MRNCTIKRSVGMNDLCPKVFCGMIGISICRKTVGDKFVPLL